MPMKPVVGQDENEERFFDSGRPLSLLPSQLDSLEENPEDESERPTRSLGLPNRAARRGGAGFARPSLAHPPVRARVERVEETPTAVVEMVQSAKGTSVVSPVSKKLQGKQVPVDTVLSVDCSLVFPLRDQPRTYFDEAEFIGLVNSIAESGQIQTVPAVSLPNGTFRIRDGERRWRACTRLKIKVRLAVVQELPHEEEIEQAAIANFLRQGHTPIEQARIFMRLKEGPLKRSVAEIAKKFGMTMPTVYNHLMLIEKLDPRVQQLMDPVVQGGAKHILRPSIAQYLTAFHEKREEQVRLATEIMKRKLNLRKAKTLIDKRADKLKIVAGRGREAQPYDHIRTIKRTIGNVELVLDRFSNFSPGDWEKLWKTHSWTEREAVAKNLRALIDRLEKLHGHIDETLNKRASKKG